MRTIARLSGALKLFLLLAAIGGRFSAGRNTDGRGFFLNIKVPETYRAEQLEYRYDTDLVEKLGATVSHSSVALPVTSADREYAESLLSMNGISPQDFIVGINPGGQPSRRWPREHFVALINQLTREGCKIVLTGSDSEKHLCGAIAAAAGGRGIADVSGTTTVEQLAALISRCKLYVSNDTGAMHVCVAQGVPGVFLFGGGNLTRFAPFQHAERYVLLQKKVHCSPCEHFQCDRLACMKQISPAEAADAIRRLRSIYYA
jgi:ADP-heptose:LPS heptosyltransferase